MLPLFEDLALKIDFWETKLQIVEILPSSISRAGFSPMNEEFYYNFDFTPFSVPRWRVGLAVNSWKSSSSRSMTREVTDEPFYEERRGMYEEL